MISKAIKKGVCTNRQKPDEMKTKTGQGAVFIEKWGKETFKLEQARL